MIHNEVIDALCDLAVLGYRVAYEPIVGDGMRTPQL